jgi:chromosomal replication initiator protein
MDVWAQVLSAVRRRVSQQCFDTWFRPVVFCGNDETCLRIKVPNSNFRQWLLDNYAPLLLDAIHEITRAPLQLDVSIETYPAEVSVSKTGAPDMGQPSSLFNPRYTFASFVVGSSNQFAHAAALAVAENPSRAYNPLYVYGGVGLGKTHLMHAIGHFIQDKNPKLRLSYLSSERFMNELVNAIRYERTIQFREKYRNIDVLLMDDVQFIAGKERTQEEFFHTFNALYDAQKQIVITSDCAPKDIPAIEERLHSRFEWGLIADIQPPDLETKLAILKKKAELEMLPLPDTIAMYIATSIRSNIRELEGALIRLAARASLDGLDPLHVDLDYAREVLKNIVSEPQRPISSDMIIRAVAAHFGLHPSVLRSKNNSRRIAGPRQIAMYLCKKLTNLSLPQIGHDFGGKHHTTVLHSIRKVERDRASDHEMDAAIGKISQSFI